MNIIEAFIKFNKKLIIILSGLSGSGKTSIAKLIERDFKLSLINIEDFVIEDFNKTETLSNGTKIINWDDVESYDWNKINQLVNDNKSKGIILCGPFFPVNKLKFDADFHIQIKIQKQSLIEKRTEYAKQNIKKFKNLDENILLIVNKITYPLFLKYSSESKIDKYINSKDLTKDQIYDQIADFLFFKINEYLQNRFDNLNKVEHSNKATNKTKNDDSSEFNFDSSSTSFNLSNSSSILNLLNESDEKINLIGSDDNKQINFI